MDLNSFPLLYFYYWYAVAISLILMIMQPWMYTHDKLEFEHNYYLECSTNTTIF